MHKVTATIKKCGSKWCLYSKKSGRLLGKHDTKEKALKQEAAIHARRSVAIADARGIMSSTERAVWQEFRLGGITRQQRDAIVTAVGKIVGHKPKRLARSTERLLGVLDVVAEALEDSGEDELAEVVDEAAEELDAGRFDVNVLYPPNVPLEKMLDETGFDWVVKRDEDVARKVHDTDPSLIEMYDLYG